MDTTRSRSESSPSSSRSQARTFSQSLSELGESIPELVALSIVTLPDCLPYLHWSAADHDESWEDRAVHAGDLVQTLRRKLVALGSLEPGVVVTIQSTDGSQIMREIGGTFALLCCFRSELPLGMGQVLVRQIAARLSAWAWQRVETWSATD